MKLGDPTLNIGTISADVKTVQLILQGQGYNVGPIDGNYGPQTQAAIVSFQKAHNLLPDGIVGPATWAALKGEPMTAQIVPVASTPPPAPKPVSAGPSTTMMVVYGVGALAFLTLMMGGRR